MDDKQCPDAGLRELALFAGAGGGASLAESCSDGEQSVQSSGSHTPLAYLPQDRMTAFSRLSRSGTTFKPLTGSLGADLLTWYLGDSLARHSAVQQEEGTRLEIIGQKCLELSERYSLNTCLPRMSAKIRSATLRLTLQKLDTVQLEGGLALDNWVQITLGTDGGWLHTPTCAMNWATPSMQKWECCRRAVAVFGRPNPTNQEWMMAWPRDWTDLKPLEADNAHWQQHALLQY